MKFKPDFDGALEIINSSETKNVFLYRENENKNMPDYVGQVLFNYVQTIIKNKEYEMNLLNSNLENYTEKVWNICLINISNQCYEPLMKIKVLNDTVLEGGIRLSLWESKR